MSCPGQQLVSTAAVLLGWALLCYPILKYKHTIIASFSECIMCRLMV